MFASFSFNLLVFCHKEGKYGIRTIRLYGDATIEEQGKLSLCYEKNISQDATCRKVFVVGCTVKVLSSLGLAEICHSV
jgi:hypothetical protein